MVTLLYSTAPQNTRFSPPQRAALLQCKNSSVRFRTACQASPCSPAPMPRISAIPQLPTLQGFTRSAISAAPSPVSFIVIKGENTTVDVKRLPKKPAPPRFGRKLTAAQKARATHICLDCGECCGWVVCMSVGGGDGGGVSARLLPSGWIAPLLLASAQAIPGCGRDVGRIGYGEGQWIQRSTLDQPAVEASRSSDHSVYACRCLNK